MPESRFKSLIEAYQNGPGQIRRAVFDLSPQQLTTRPIAGKWSSLEVICHLTDSEQAWCHRMKRVIAEEKPLLIGYDESRFTTSLCCHQRDLNSELSLIEAMRLQMAQILQGTPDNSWSRFGVHSERGLISLEEMVRIEVEHVSHHITQIIEKRQVMGC